MNFDVCPEWNSCNHTAEKSFWRAASIALSKSARGIAYVMFNGSHPDRPPFRHNSVFAQYELPNFNLPNIKDIKVILVNNLGSSIRRDCGDSSLVELK